MKHKLFLCTAFVFLLLFSGCGKTEAPTQKPTITDSADITAIALSDDAILVNGEAISTDSSAAVYQANDIVFYLNGQDFTYGEGSEDEAHSQDEANKQTVVHITKPGTYSVNGKLSAGQIAIDLGEDAKEDPNAVVNLILDNADITCDVAPGIIFYSVYECGDKDEENATYDVDTTAAGANIILADDSTNVVNGSHVAKIYKSVTLSDDGTEVVDSKKLHKYDGAVYSKMSMNVFGEDNGTGALTINADNEGLDSELHLSIFDGNITINSGNDGINTNEDNISVTTIHGGTLTINVTGTTGEGDGIDSNGWLVINGGTVNAFACGASMDSGIDSDMGIHINGGTVIASGNMLDRIENEDVTYSVFSFIQKVPANTTLTLKDEAGNTVMDITSVNEFSNLLVADSQIALGTYTLWENDTQYGCLKEENGGKNMFRPGDGNLPENMPPDGDFSDFTPPDGDFSDVMPPEGENPGKVPMEKDPGKRPQRGDFPQDDANMEDFPMVKPSFEEGELPENFEMPDGPNGNIQVATAPEFVVTKGANYFSYVEVIN